MKIQLDTTAKIIRLENSIKLDEFFTKIKKLLPNDEWKQFTLETNTTIVGWREPYVITDWQWRPLVAPWYSTSTTLSDHTIQCSLKSGTYNIEY